MTQYHYGMELNSANFQSQWLNVTPVGTKAMPFDNVFLENVRASGAIEGMWSWLPRLSGGGTSFDAYADRIVKLTEEKKFFPLMMFDKTDNDFIGGAAFLRQSRTHRTVEIGFIWLNESYQRWKFFAAMQDVLIRRASECGLQRIVWQVSPENERMMRAVEKLGAKHEGVMRAACRLNNGDWTDMALYSIVGEEIPATLLFIEGELEGGL